MTIEFEPIPQFLKLTKEQRAQAWKDRKLTQVRGDRKRDWHLPKTLSLEAKALIKSQRREKAQKLLALRKKRRKGA